MAFLYPMKTHLQEYKYKENRHSLTHAQKFTHKNIRLIREVSIKFLNAFKVPNGCGGRFQSEKVNE